MRIAEAVEKACQEPSLVAALSFICLWESERIVKQAHKNLTNNTPANPDTGQMWETCFEICIKSVLDRYVEPRKWELWM